MSSLWKVFISVVATIIIIGGGVYYYMQRQIDKVRSDNQTQIDNLNKQIKTLQSSSSTSTSSATTDETANWKTYTNDKYSYSVKYPEIGWTPYNDDEKAADSQKTQFRLANYDFNYDPGYQTKSGEAIIFITADNTNKTLAEISDGYHSSKVKKTIHGVEFYFTDRTNEASDEGGTINTLVYFTVKDGVHYSILLTPASPGAFIVDAFNQIANTFQFTK